MQLSYYKRPLVVALALYAGAILLFRDVFAPPPAPAPFPLPRGSALVSARIAEYPSLNRGRWRFALDDVKLYGRPFPAGLMADARDLRGASYGDRVEFLADLYAPAGQDAPGSLDWAGFLARRGIAAEAHVRDLEVTRPAGPLLRLARGFRYRALAAFEKNLAPGPASVFSGVVIGEKKSVPPDIRAAFQDSGAMHLLVASGSNVGFVAVIVYFFCSLARLRRRWSGLAALAVSGFYVLASGLDAPLVRAYLMFAAGLTAFMFRRETGAFHSLTLAALAILLLSPRALFDAGFQMSFLAAYGLTAGMAIWGSGVNSAARSGAARVAGALRLPPALAEKPAATLAGLLAVSFFAQLFLFPPLVAYFHRVSSVSLVSNIILVPASGVAMALGFLMTALAGTGALFAWLARACGFYMDLFIGAVKFFAGLPFASFSVPEPSALSIAGFYVLALALLHAPLTGFRSRRLYAAAFLGASVMAAGPSAGRGKPERGWVKLFGGGETYCALVSLPGEGLYLVNPGLSGKKLAAAVLETGGTELAGVLLTSAGEKNSRGLAELARTVTVKKVYLPYGPSAPGFPGVLAGLRSGGTAVERLWPGENSGPAKAFWPEGARGYTGLGPVTDWQLGPVLISADGASASSGGRGIAYQPREVGVLNFGDMILNSK